MKLRVTIDFTDEYSQKMVGDSYFESDNISDLYEAVFEQFIGACVAIGLDGNIMREEIGG